MKKHYSLKGFIVVVFLVVVGKSWGQTSVQNFGTGAGSHTSQTGSTTFLSSPTNGTTWARAGATDPNAPVILANTSNPLGTTGSFVRGVASTSTSVTKVSPILGYTAGKSFYTKFSVLFGDASAGTSATSGSWTYFQGSGTSFSNASAITGTETFVGLRFTFGASGAVTLTNNVNGAYNSTGLSTNSFSQGIVYTIELVGNNSLNAIGYLYNGTNQNVAVDKLDLYINGIQIGNDLAKAQLANNADIRDISLTGINSASNVANIFVDDVVVYNAIPSSIGNQAPTDISLSGDQQFENNVIGATIGQFITTDADAGQSHTYTLVSGTGSTDNASFTIDGNTLKAATSFDYETKSSYTIRVRTTDNGSPAQSYEEVFIITVIDLTEVTYYPVTGATNLAAFNNWTANFDGSVGSQPGNFFNNSYIFNINKNAGIIGTLSLGGSDLLITNGATLTMQSTGRLETTTTNSDVDFNGNSVVIKSDASNTASIGGISGSLTDATNVTVERYIPAKKAWRLLTSPVTGTTINAAWQGGTTWDGTGGNPTSTGQYTLITGQQQGSAATANGNGFDFWSDIANSSASVRKYLGTTTGGSYTPLANTTSPITNEQAYMLFVRGDKSVTSGTEVPTVLRPTGALRTGTQSLTVKGTNTQKFTLLGNPYASSIDFEQVILNADNNTKIYERFWIWAADQGSFGAYRLVNRTGTNMYEVIPSPYNVAGTTGTTAQHIQSSQGFFVEALQTADATLIVEENDKSNPGTVYSVFRTGNTNERLNINLNHLNADNTATLADGVQAKYGSDFSASIAAEDIQKPNNFNENLAIHRSGSYLIVEGRPLVNSTDTTYLNLWNTTQRSYQFQLKAENFSSSSVSAYLVDKYLNTSTVINLSGDVSSINFAVNGDAASKAIDRFMIVYRTNSTLPVNFTNIKAAQKLTAIQVEWNIATETNTKTYEVEKSNNGQQFVKASTVQAAGKDSYGWLDAAPFAGINYYRIKGISDNGEIKYSSVVRVNISSAKSGVTVYPNPVSEKSFNLQLNNKEKGTYTLRLINSAGQLVFSSMVNHSGGSSSQNVQLNKELPKGIYQLEITGEDRAKETIRIISNKD
ncbi:MAG TPA: T9SS type A sorting domain-containing protein [Segetibacter sp.]|jgi:hypothetical protein